MNGINPDGTMFCTEIGPCVETLCPIHGDVRDTSVRAQILPFVLRERPAPESTPCFEVRIPRVFGPDALRVAEAVTDALTECGVLFSGDVEVSRA